MTCSRRRGVGHGFGGLPREILRPRGQGRSGAGARDISDRQSCSRRSRPESSNENHRPCRGGPKDATGRRRRNGNFVAAPNDRVPRCPSRTTGVTSVKGAPKAAEGSPRTGSPCRGTGSSNPVPSRGESANSRSLPRPKTRVQSSSLSRERRIGRSGRAALWRRWTNNQWRPTLGSASRSFGRSSAYSPRRECARCSIARPEPPAGSPGGRS